MGSSTHYPRTVSHKGQSFTVRQMTLEDSPLVLDFAARQPVHDLLFLARDIRNPKVVAAWVETNEKGAIHTLLAFKDNELVGIIAIVRDEHSWSRHVGDIRLLISPEMRGAGLGRLLLQEGFSLALALDIEKLTARMTPDQVTAIALFEDLGFRPEALLREHVRDANDVAQDLVVFSLSTERSAAQRQAFGMDGAAA